MSYKIDIVLKEYVEDIQRLYGDQLKTVILYGSYARGDYRPDSDIDIMILVTSTDQEIWEKGHQLSDLTFEYNFDQDMAIMPIVKNIEHFNRWLHAYPFYYNVKKEGVELYEGIPAPHISVGMPFYHPAALRRPTLARIHR